MYVSTYEGKSENECQKSKSNVHTALQLHLGNVALLQFGGKGGRFANEYLCLWITHNTIEYVFVFEVFEQEFLHRW